MLYRHASCYSVSMSSHRLRWSWSSRWNSLFIGWAVRIRGICGTVQRCCSRSSRDLGLIHSPELPVDSLPPVIAPSGASASGT
ncbi:hypothetical protein GDO81_013600 [Engystomops pustulosus]|uniref:Secreted protein n=1 Tax=Engystomops pustulosus TaxID=76066 RepID=A0AAV7B477_ENGPU|nr:hypothetical protein GDO81_013600 [Engystomops pustulosus]